MNWLRWKPRQKTFGLTEWHCETVKDMADAATETLGRNVSQNAVVKAAIDMLAVNFDPAAFAQPQERGTRI